MRWASNLKFTVNKMLNIRTDFNPLYVWKLWGKCFKTSRKKVIFVTRIHEQYVVGAFRWVIILMGKKFSNYEIICLLYKIVETISHWQFHGLDKFTVKQNPLKVAFFRKCDAVFPLPKKCAENYPEQEILILCCVLCKQKARENWKYKS